MNKLSEINSFIELETKLSTASVQVSCWGHRSVIIVQKNEKVSKTNIEVSLHQLLDYTEQLYKKNATALSVSENQAGKRIITHVINSLLNKCNNTISNNCFIRLIIAIRDFFTCFFRGLQHKIRKIDRLLNQPTERTIKDQPDNPPNPSFENPTSQMAIGTTEPTAVTKKRFDNMKTIFSTIVIEYLSSGSYAALSSTDKMMNSYMKLHDMKHIRFDHLRLKLANNIELNRSETYSFQVPETNDISYAIYQDHLLYVSPLHGLVQTNIRTGEIIKKINSIPSEVCFPPRIDDCPIGDCGEIERINSKYFFIRCLYGEISIWKVESMQAICAWKPQIVSYTQTILLEDQNQFAIVQSEEHQGTPNHKKILSVQIIRLDDSKAVPIRYQITLPERLLEQTTFKLSNRGITCSLENGWIYHYEWRKKTPLVTARCNIGFFLTDSGSYFCGKKFLFFQQSSDNLNQLRTVELSTGNERRIENVNRPLSFLSAIFFKEFLVIPNKCILPSTHETSIFSFFIFNTNNGTLVREIGLLPKPFESFDLQPIQYFNSAGELILKDSKGISFYNPATGKEISSLSFSIKQSPRSLSACVTENDILVRQARPEDSRPRTTPSEPVEVIDLLRHKYLMTNGTQDEVMLFEEGWLISYQRIATGIILKCVDYNPKVAAVK